MNTYIWKNRRICRTCNVARQKPQRYKSKYGLTLQQVAQMVIDQDGKCPICLSEFTEVNPYNVDHDHSCCPGEFTCGKCVRALLCQDCNLSLGRFKDSVNILESAISYLHKYNKLGD